MTSEESFYMVGTHSTVEKQAKRMPDTTVKTTKINKYELFSSVKTPT